MTRLTEEMVSLRTKISNMSHVKKLNCWGTGITDISVVKKMKNIEVLALSVNSISSLEAVRDLPYLETLYLRKNQIKDLTEVVHLKSLPALKFVWLDENPFCEKLGSKYRGTILRMLPHLERLDDKEITDSDRQNAINDTASTTTHDDQDTFDDAYETEPQQQQQQQQGQPQNPNSQQITQHYYQAPAQQQQFERSLHSPPLHQHSPPSQQNSPPFKQNSPPLQAPPPLQHHQSAQMQQPYQRQPPYLPPENSYSPPHSQQQLRNSPHESTHPPSPKYDSTPQQNRLSYQQPNERSPEHDSPQIGYQSCYRESGPIPSSISTQSMKEYYQSDRPSYPLHYARSQTDLSDWTENQLPPTRRSAGNEREILERHGFRANGSVLRENGLYDSVPRRLLNRNSNLLSATLCLIKEMDINSLEVVEHAVRSRLNEYATD